MNRRIEIPLASRSLPDGASYVELTAEVDALVVHEEDVGGTPDSIFGSGGVDYYLTVRGAEQMARLLERLGHEVGRDLTGPVTKAWLRRVGAAMLQLFGSDLQLVGNYRSWLKANKIEFTTHVI